MKIDINNHSLSILFESVINNITTNVHVDKYFGMSSEQKLIDQVKVFKIFTTSLRFRKSVLDELELKNYVSLLREKSEELEKYEVSEILKDIMVNAESLIEITKRVQKPVRRIKTNNNEL